MYVEFSFFRAIWLRLVWFCEKKIVNLPQHNNYAKIKRIGEI